MRVRVRVRVRVRTYICVNNTIMTLTSQSLHVFNCHFQDGQLVQLAWHLRAGRYHGGQFTHVIVHLVTAFFLNLTMLFPLKHNTKTNSKYYMYKQQVLCANTH